METTIMGLYKDYIEYILLGLYRVMEKKMETTKVYRDYIGVI